MIDRKELLIIGKVWPEPNSSAAGSRMMQLISLFQDDGWNITFGSAATESNYSEKLEETGIQKKTIELNHSDFDEFVREVDPSVVLFDRYMTEEQFGWRVAENCPDALRVLDTEDLHCLRKARENAFKNNTEFNVSILLKEKISRREIASIYRSDLSLIISEAEMDILTQIFNVDPSLLYYLPFLLDPVTDSVQEDWPAYRDRIHFVTIGNFLHEPNTDSIEYLKRDIWPLIRKALPGAELHVYGAYPTERVKQLHSQEEGVLILGRAEDAKHVILKAKVLLAPLRFGAGLKGKLIEAMLCGTPSVTTPIGAEGISPDGFIWNGHIANNPKIFAEKAVELYSNKSAWEKSQHSGVKIINQRFQKGDFKQAFLSYIAFLIKDLEKHRNRNFIGSMLTHHTAASSKFMSKWIELKNRNR